jgi:hypothetical protein
VEGQRQSDLIGPQTLSSSPGSIQLSLQWSPSFLSLLAVMTAFGLCTSLVLLLAALHATSSFGESANQATQLLLAHSLQVHDLYHLNTHPEATIRQPAASTAAHASRKLLQTKPPTAPTSACACTSDFDPVCGTDGEMHSNECEARCFGAEAVGVPLVSSAGECIGLETPCRVCHPVPAWQPRLGNVSTPSPCGCTEYPDPVCGSDNVTYVNRCAAKCANANMTSMVPAPRDAVPGDRCSVGVKEPMPDWKPCASIHYCSNRLHLYPPGPVCGSDGLAYANRCEAECANVTVVRVAPAGAKWLQQCPPAALQNSSCGCSDTVDPVCVVRGGFLYKNACEARCANVTVHGKPELAEAPLRRNCPPVVNGPVMQTQIAVERAAMG